MIEFLTHATIIDWVMIGGLLGCICFLGWLIVGGLWS